MYKPTSSICSILVVEDDTITAKLLAKMVKMRFPHCSIITAANGINGYELCKEFSPDLILADINLPVVDGLEMVKLIRASNREVAIITLTASSKTDGFENLGISSHHVKPFSFSKLIDAIESCCPACRNFGAFPPPRRKTPEKTPAQ